jgi:hypothetical protein
VITIVPVVPIDDIDSFEIAVIDKADKKQNIVDVAGNKMQPGTFRINTNLNPPLVSSISVANNNAEVVFNQKIAPLTTYKKDDFSLKLSGTEIPIASINISNNKIIVTPSNEQITDVSAVQVTYSRNISIVSQRVVSIIGVELGSFTKKGDEEDETASQFVSASLVGNVFILAMNEKMADKDYDKANFDLKKSGVRLGITSIVIDNNLVKITPSGETITDLSSVKFDYTPGGDYNKNLVDIVGNSMDSFTYLGDPNPNAPAMQTIALDDGNIKITLIKR